MLGDNAERLTALWRDQQRQYTWLRAVRGHHADDRRCPRFRTLNVNETGLGDRLMRLYLTLAVFPEVPEVLGRLKAAELIGA